MASNQIEAVSGLPNSIDQVELYLDRLLHLPHIAIPQPTYPIDESQFAHCGELVSHSLVRLTIHYYKSFAGIKAAHVRR